MSPRGCRAGALVLLATLAAVPAALAQTARWHITAEVATSRLGGGATGTVEGDEVTAGPHDPTLYGIRLERLGRRIGLGLSVRYSKPGFAFGDADVTILDSELGFRLVELAPEASLHIAGTATGAALRARLGPVLDIWSWDLADSQTRLGARFGLGADLPIGGRFAAALSTGVTLTGSMLSQADVGSDFEMRSVVRTEVGVGLRYSLR